MHTSERRSPSVAAWLLFCLALAYLPDMGHGFISDDFGWILHSRLSSLDDLRRLFVETPMGFYRPLVSLSFFLNWHVSGLTPIGYALVNFALVWLIALGIVALCRAHGFSRLEGLFAAGIWTFNIHGVGMALTWISGRTSLLATLFAVLAGTCVLRRRSVLGALFTLAALLAKEEPLLLPLIFSLWLVITPDPKSASADDSANSARTPLPVSERMMRAWKATWPCYASLALYLVLRANTAALTPWNAPSFYALSVAPSVVVPNVLEYADRAVTFGAAVVVLEWLLFVRRVPRWTMLERVERRAVLNGMTWLLLGFAVTVLVPGRSDLYACFPSIGVSLMALAAGRALWRLVPPVRRRAAVVALLTLPLLLVPVYRGRNVFARNDAELSSDVVRRAVSALRDRDDITRVEVYQEANQKPSVASALNAHLGTAIELVTGRSVTAEVHLTSPSDRWPSPSPGTLRLTVSGEEIVAVAPPQ